MPEQLKTLPCVLMPQSGDAEVGACLTEDEILAFVQGDLSSRKLERMHDHVDRCDVCQRLLAEAAHALDVATPSESVRPSWNTVFQQNSLVGKRYRILRLIARGGMGEVYEAFDSALHERVALKTVTSTNCDSARAVRRLKAEVQLARRITHPNVCRIYDLGAHLIESSGAEMNFLVMEFVDGECLGKKLRDSGALSVELANSIAKQLLLGLRAAHHAGILHRDFKSENVMLRSEGGGGLTPVILDFGLARTLNETGNFATTQNQNQAMIGTIGYMAPEQIEGEPLSTASDIYAFGVVWFEMLTGRLPFEGSSPAASAIARLHRPAEAPSSVNPRVPKWLDDIVLKCLSRERAARFGSAEQVLRALETASSVSSPEATLRSPRKRRSWPLVAVAGASVLIVYGFLLENRTQRPHTTSTKTLAATPMHKLEAFPALSVQLPALFGAQRQLPVTAPSQHPRKPTSVARAPSRLVSPVPVKPTAATASPTSTVTPISTKPKKQPDWLPLGTSTPSGVGP